MPLYWLVILITGVATATLSELSQRAEALALQANVSAIAYNLMVYRQALAIYAQSNSGVAGAVDDSVLGLPTWFVHQPGVKGYIAGGLSYSFYDRPPAGLASKLAELADGSTAVGYNAEGRLVSPDKGVTMIFLPTAIPNGAAVLYR